MDELTSCGMRGFMLCWLKSWLEGRAQGAVVSGASSGWQLFTSSIPQGSALGLFSLFITDLNAGFDCTFSKFTGTTTLGGAVSSLEGQEGLERGIWIDWSIGLPLMG